MLQAIKKAGVLHEIIGRKECSVAGSWMYGSESGFSVWLQRGKLSTYYYHSLYHAFWTLSDEEIKTAFFVIKYIVQANSTYDLGTNKVYKVETMHSDVGLNITLTERQYK